VKIELRNKKKYVNETEDRSEGKWSEQNRKEGRIKMKIELRNRKKYVDKMEERSEGKWSELKPEGEKDKNEDRAKKYEEMWHKITKQTGQKQNEESRKGDGDVHRLQTASEGRVRLFVFVSLTGMAGRRRRPDHILNKHSCSQWTRWLSLRDSLQ